MDAPWVVTGKARHRRDALPVRDGHELALAGAVLAQHLHAERFLHQRLDAMLVEIVGVFVGLGGRGAAAPYAGNRRTHIVCGRGHGISSIGGPACSFTCSLYDGKGGISRSTVFASRDTPRARRPTAAPAPCAKRGERAVIPGRG